jgi:branched-chain amino acid transport system permease protein
VKPPSHPAVLALLLALLGLALVPQLADRFYVQLVTKMMVMGIFAMSLDLLVGYTRLVSFGHAAFYGLAGYALAVLQRDLGLLSLWTTLPLTLLVVALAAILIGALAIRTTGIYFIMVTLAFAQMLYYAASDTRAFGGSDGMFLSVKPTVELFGFELLDLKDRATFFYFVLGALTACFVLARIVLASLFGRVIDAIRCNEMRAQALGFAPWRFKLAMFTIAGIMGGFAGYLGAAQDLIVNPAFLSWHQSGQALVMVILGGMGTLIGPVIGAFAMLALEDLLSHVTEHWLLLIGLFVIAVVLLLPRGIVSLSPGAMLALARRPRARAAPPTAAAPAEAP